MHTISVLISPHSRRAEGEERKEGKKFEKEKAPKHKQDRRIHNSLVLSQSQGEEGVGEGGKERERRVPPRSR